MSILASSQNCVSLEWCKTENLVTSVEDGGLLA